VAYKVMRRNKNIDCCCKVCCLLWYSKRGL